MSPEVIPIPSVPEVRNRFDTSDVSKCGLMEPGNEKIIMKLEKLRTGTGHTSHALGLPRAPAISQSSLESSKVESLFKNVSQFV